MNKLQFKITVSSLLATTALAGLLAASPVVVQAAAPVPSAAPDQLGEIVVTAQRRAEKSLDVPVTVSSLSASQLTAAGVVSLSDISKLTPALRFDSDGTFVQPSIRGVGTAITTSGGGPNVGIYVDGFFQSNPEAADFQLLNIQNIQVLKGPQGTLFGRNTTGGAIVVTTADPSTTTGGQIKADYGSFNSRTVQVYGTTGLSDRAAVDLEAIYHAGDGFQHEILAGGPAHPGAYENWSVRTGLKVNVTDNVSVLLRYGHSSTSDPTLNLANSYVDKSGSANFFSPVSPAGQAIYQTNFGVSNSRGLPLANLGISQFVPGAVATSPNDVSDNQALFQSKSDTVQGTIKADLGFATLTSYSQFRTDTSLNHEDLDATGVEAFNILIGVKDTTYSQEFLLNSKPGGRLQWVAGADYYWTKDDWTNIQASFGGAPYTPFGGSSTTTESAAVFADATYEIVPAKLFVDVGGRYSHDLVTDAFFKTNFTTTSYEGPQGQSVPFAGAPGTVIPVADLPHDEFTPRLVLRYKPTDDSSLYASYSRGYKAGILNVGGDSQKPVNPETNDAFEVGYKFDNRQLSIDLASYYYDYKNLQVSSFQAGAAEIRNAADAQIYGVEAQGRYRFDHHFDVNAAVAWTHARYTSFSNSPYYSFCDPSLPLTIANPAPPPATIPNPNPLVCSQGPGGVVETTVNAKNFQMQRAPEFTATLSANYRFDMLNGETTLSGNLYYTSKFYFDPSQQFVQNGYALLGLHAQWVDPSHRYTIAVYGDNVTDQRYQTQVIANTLGIGSVWSAPATWGVSLGAKF